MVYGPRGADLQQEYTMKDEEKEAKQRLAEIERLRKLLEDFFKPSKPTLH
jgi:hypothetical protein